MDKQQAADRAYPENFPTSDNSRKIFIAGADWHAQQSPTDAVDFIQWIVDNGYYVSDMKVYKITNRSSGMTLDAAYKLFNPSGAAPQAINKKVLTALKELHNYTKGHKSLVGHVKFEHLKAQAIEAIAEAGKLLIPPAAAGPVWVKAKDPKPTESGNYNIKYNGSPMASYYHAGMKKFCPIGSKVAMTGQGLIEWLDESGAQVFTRKQMEDAFNTHPVQMTFNEYMNTNYPNP